MANWSKFWAEIEPLPCRSFAHPWTDNCLSAAAFTWVDSFVGSAGFFTFLYLLQYVSTVLKKKKKGSWKDLLRTHIRSTICGATVSTGTFGTHCLLRRLLGKFHYYTIVFIPAVIGGCAIYMESRKGRELFVNAFANCALELWIRLLEQSQVLKWNPNVQTVLFMILSSFLCSLFSCTNYNLNYFWFFIPPKINEKDENDKRKEHCFHKGNCAKHILNLFIMYSSTGLALQFFRLFFNNFKNPTLFLLSLSRPKTFKLAAFLGGYVVIHQTIRCFLYQKEKKYSLFHDSLAGFLAGIAFRFQPTIPIFNSALITIIQILTETCYQRRLIPNIPYLEILFSFFCGVLFHSRILLSEHCPQLMVYIMSAVTHGMSDRTTHTYKNILNNWENLMSGSTKNKKPIL